jgi:integrase
LRHSFVFILSASDVPPEDISLLVRHVSASVTETVYQQEIRPALTRISKDRLAVCSASGSPLAP